MRLSREWLSDYLNFSDVSDERFCELITTRVAEVDSMNFAGIPAEAAVIALITAVRQHPSRSSLTVATVRIARAMTASGEVASGVAEIEVVCGAANVRAGMLTAYLAPGAQLASPKSDEAESLLAVVARDIDGVMSTGVLVSERELGLTAEHAGIVEITPEWLAGALKSKRGMESGGVVLEQLVGTKLSELIPCRDTLLEIDNKSLTHRPDLWCHFGFAREMSAILHRPLIEDIDQLADVDEHGSRNLAALAAGPSGWSVVIAPGAGCRRFTAVEINGVSAAASPLWLRRRLSRVGAGVRNVIVDLSNYCLHDIGQPNHTADADALKGKTITVRRGRAGEAFTALDGASRELSPEDIVIADEAGPVGLGGVIGGEGAAVKSSTTRLLLENANFDPVVIRRTTVRYALRTDASNRFEKSLSAYNCAVGIRRFVGLLAELQPQATLGGAVVDTFAERPAAVTVPLRCDYIRARVGADIPDPQIEQMLTGLGFRPMLVAADGTTGGPSHGLLHVPYYRATRDISIEDDLVEEVGRIYGYENVPEQAPKISSVAAPVRKVADFERLIRDMLCGNGFSEAYHYSFMNSALAGRAGYDGSTAVELKNPVDADFSQIRTTLVPGLLEALERNLKHSPQVLMFELGRGYETVADPRHGTLKFRTPVKNPAAFERRLLGILYAGGKDEAELTGAVTPAIEVGADFFAVVGTIERLVKKVARAPVGIAPLAVESLHAESITGCSVNGLAPRRVSAAGDYSAYKSWMHPYRAATIAVSGTAVGVVAEVGPRFKGQHETRAVIAELDLELLLEADTGELLFAPLSKYPDSLFEVSVVAPRRTYAAELEQVVRLGVPADLLRKVETVAVYQGKPLAEGEKSVSFKLYLGSDQRTLSGEELQRVHAQVLKAVADSAFSLRS